LKKAEIVIAGVLATTTASTSVSSAQEAQALGAGGQLCGEWTTERQKASATQSASGTLWGQSQWILGYVSAMNLALAPHTNFAEGLKGSAMLAWVDNYCRSHALDQLATAASALVLELRHRATTKKN
jgi:hypothetical protein